MHTWMDEQILILDGIIDSVVDPEPKRGGKWICAAVGGAQTHPYRITDGQRDYGHYASMENAKRALDFLEHGIDG